MSLFYQFCSLTSWSYFKIFYDCKIEGVENVPDTACILASNHVSFYDPPLIGSSIRPQMAHYLARKSLFSVPILDITLPSLKCIAIDQDKPDMTGLKKMIHTLREGHKVLMFPEGSRSYDGKLLPAQPGIGLVLSKVHVPVIPIRLFGVHEAWPRDGKITLFKPIRVVFGKPILSEKSHVKSSREEYQRISETILEAISKIE